MKLIPFDLIIYGGSFSGVAAAAKAAAHLHHGQHIALIVPDPVSSDGNGICLGSIGTLGGQNFFDQRRWQGTLVTKGSYAWWAKGGNAPYYSTESMDLLLKQDLAKYGSTIQYFYGYDIESLSRRQDGRISQVTLRQLERAPKTGYVLWGQQQVKVSGRIWIDASESGRLARLAGVSCTAGRYDWPAELLEPEERSAPGQAHQQAATLMFQVTRFDRTISHPDLSAAPHSNGVWSAVGGRQAYREDPIIRAFNDQFGPKGYALKPFNMAQDGPEQNPPSDTPWWVNMLLVFGVDGRAYERDRSTQTSAAFPSDMRPDYKTTDQAWAEARMILNQPEFLTALRRFPGFAQAELVRDAEGAPVTGQILYLRESLHAVRSQFFLGCNTENSNYALHTLDCHHAGASQDSGGDTRHYDQRIGLNYYWSDINAYQFQDLKNQNGEYIWFNEVGDALRHDLGITRSTPHHPVFVPYQTLLTPQVSNLLLSGYAASMSSFAWAEARVLPNQCVLGDAAGIAAAYAIFQRKVPLHFHRRDLHAVQRLLLRSGARLEK